MTTITAFFNPLILPISHARLPKFTSCRPSKICCAGNDRPQQVNLSVLRFTLGIPGLDESYLPRYIGYAFGALLVANHFLASDSSSITPPQLRTEAVGLLLAAFSAVVPYLGKFLKGAEPTGQKSIPEGAEQIFVMSDEVTDNVKEDLAWATYALLRNTNSISVLISVEDALCVRGYWKTPKGLPKQDVLNWFRKQIERSGLHNLKDTVYFQQATESEVKKIFGDGTKSVLVQPMLRGPKVSSSESENSTGFVLLASSIDFAYGNKDQAWIAAIANKFRCTGEF